MIAFWWTHYDMIYKWVKLYLLFLAVTVGYFERQCCLCPYREECRPTIDGRESRKYWLSIIHLGKVTLPYFLETRVLNMLEGWKTCKWINRTLNISQLPIIDNPCVPGAFLKELCNQRLPSYILSYARLGLWGKWKFKAWQNFNHLD